MKDTPGLVLLVLAVVFFFLAALLLALVLSFSCCGVGFWSPQVSWRSRFNGLAIPVVPFLLGVGCLIVRRATRIPKDAGSE